MKSTNKLRVLAALCIAIPLLPMALSAQPSPATSPVTGTYSTTTDDRGDRHEHHNYGWIGLLGLLGLAGLIPKKREDHIRHDTVDRRTDDRL
jgi:hypothetical protein